MLNSKGIISEISEVKESDYYSLSEYLSRGWEICGSRSTIIEGRVIIQRRWEVPGFVQFILGEIRNSIEGYNIDNFEERNQKIKKNLKTFKNNNIIYNSEVPEYKDIRTKIKYLDDRVELFRDIKWFVQDFLVKLEEPTYFTSIPELVIRFSKYF